MGDNVLIQGKLETNRKIVQEVYADKLGHLGVALHAHSEGGHALLEVAGIAASVDLIFIDVSDTVNYPHENDTFIHMSNIILDVDASNTADYDIFLGFLDNVDGTSGDFHHVYGWHGSRAVGSSIRSSIVVAPEAVACTSSKTIGPVDTNDIAFQTDVLLSSTRSPLAPDTFSGSGDIVVRVIMNAGTIDMSLGTQYHSH